MRIINAIWALNMGSPMARDTAISADSAILVIVGTATIVSAILAII